LTSRLGTGKPQTFFYSASTGRSPSAGESRCLRKDYLSGRSNVFLSSLCNCLQKGTAISSFSFNISYTYRKQKALSDDIKTFVLLLVQIFLSGPDGYSHPFYAY
jgi:hypothetical protein